ncbi:unnamed protein product, partial [Rotaria sp. Silwood2]
SLLQESAEERQRRESKIAEFEAVKNALNIIENFYINARKLSTGMMITPAATTTSSNITMSNHFGQSSNSSTNLVDNSFGSNTNRISGHHVQTNQQTWNTFGTHGQAPPVVPPNPLGRSYANGSTTPPVPILPQRPLPRVPPR